MARTTKIVSISVPDELLSTARELGINVSQAATNGITAAIEREKKIRELGL